MKHAIAALLITMSGAAVAEPELAISRFGARPVQSAPGQNFTGSAQVDMPFVPTPTSRASGGSVTLSAGARTNWHVHPRGQTLIVTAGAGRVQRWGGEVEEIRPGDVVSIPPNVKHWHGASPISAMTHIAVQQAEDGKTVDWMEPVSAGQYSPDKSAPAMKQAEQPSRAQLLMGDTAPKLAQLTDEVLFADVWVRPGLSPRDRSRVTVSALIAMHRPDQLKSHMTLGLQNGLTEAELVEALTQLAFYTGWRSAVAAVGVAREVFQGKPKQ